MKIFWKPFNPMDDSAQHEHHPTGSPAGFECSEDSRSTLKGKIAEWQKDLAWDNSIDAHWPILVRELTSLKQKRDINEQSDDICQGTFEALRAKIRKQLPRMPIIQVNLSRYRIAHSFRAVKQLMTRKDSNFPMRRKTEQRSRSPA